MTLLEILYTVQHIAQSFGKPSDMSLEQFNNLINVAQKELFNEFANGYLSGSGLEVDSRVSAAMSSFKQVDTFTSATWTSTSSFSFGVTALQFQLASNVYVPLDAWTTTNSSDYPDKVVKIDVVTTAEANERLSNSITHPSASYPILYYDRAGGATQYICYVIPATFTNVKVYNLYAPDTAELILTVSNGVYSQDAASSGLEFSPQFHIDVIRIMLKYIGLSVGNAYIREFVEQQKMQEK